MKPAGRKDYDFSEVCWTGSSIVAQMINQGARALPCLRTMIAAIILLGVNQTAAAQNRALITLDGVRLYSLPMVDETPVAVLMKGDTVRVIGQRGDWVKVEFAQEKQGWMRVQVRKGKGDHAGTRASRARNRQSHFSGAELTKTHGEAGNGTRNLPATGRDISGADDIRRPTQGLHSNTYRRFGYAFGMGLLETDFTYNWKFVFHQTERLALEGSFKHALGQAADSYLIMANFSYLLKQNDKFLPFLTAGMGVINTAPERSVDTGSVSNMAINYGVGARKYFRQNLTLLLNATMYTVFLGKGVSHFKELTIGLMVGRFWD